MPMAIIFHFTIRGSTSGDVYLKATPPTQYPVSGSVDKRVKGLMLIQELCHCELAQHLIVTTGVLQTASCTTQGYRKMAVAMKIFAFKIALPA